MKKMSSLLVLIFTIFIYSCNSTKKINKTFPASADELKTKDIFAYKSDTFKIEPDTIFIITNKAIKKVDENNIIKKDLSTVEFVGNTEIQKAISENSDIPANAGIGIRFSKTYGSPTKFLNIDKLELDITISIASTVDTINATVNTNNEIENITAFGNSILLPNNSGQSVSLNLRTFTNERNTTNLVFAQNWGFEAGLHASNRVWSYLNNSQDISTLSVKAGVFSELIPRKNNDKFSISIGVDLSTRWIFGNIGHDYADDFRNSIIGTSQTLFYGLEPNITIRLRDVRAIASFPFLFSSHDVPGLTQGQFVTMIGFTGGFPLDLPQK